MKTKTANIKVTVNKGHLLTLGEKMYRESIEFVRELVNNAYDADATEVWVKISDTKITVTDNGTGMNEKGLSKYFTVGSEEKKQRNVSPRFGRKRIGQFGIGKFSALALAEQFIVESVKGKYKYSVIFDRSDWQQNDHWELPIKKISANPLDNEGTTIILNRLKKKPTLQETEKYLQASVPLRAKKFQVFLNNKRITAKTVPGRIVPVSIKTLYGPIEGKIIIALNPRDVDEPGIECRVKQVLMKRELFGLDRKHRQGINRITGSVNADWLPLVSARSDFIKDSHEYRLFHQLLKNELSKVLAEIKRQSDSKNIKKITKELRQVMQQIREALSLNPDFVPQGKAVTRLKKAGKKKLSVASATIREKNDTTKEKNEKDKDKNQGKKDKTPPIEVKPLAIKRIRIKKLGISVGIVSLGENGPEVMSQGNAVYINQDHPLYQKLYKKRDQLTLHLFRLVTQEIVLMKKSRLSATEAYKAQSQLLKDALC